MARSDVDIRVRLLNARKFQAEAKATAASLTPLERGVKRVGTALQSAGQKMSSVGTRMTRSITLPATVAAGVAVKLGVDFDKAMRNVNSIAQLPEPAFQRLNAQVLAMAGPTAQAPQTLAEGLYDLVSSGFDARQSLKILRASATAATAGLTDTATATKTVAAVLNAYRLPASKAQIVSDTLFRTVDRGVITFEDLAQNIGDTLPFASQLGVSLAEVGAATATMTKQGLGAPETMTRIRNLLQTMIKPGEGLKDAFKELGVESGEVLIKQRGLQGALDALVGTTDGSKQALAKLFPNIRALGGALALTGKNSKAAGQDLAGMRDAAGATAHALSQQSKSIAFQWNRLLARAKVLGITIGAALGPPLFSILKSTFDVLSDLFTAFNRLPRPVKNVIVGMALFAVALGPVLRIAGFFIGAFGRIIFLVGRLIPLINALRFAFAIMWIAGLGPIALVIAGIVAVVAAFVVLYKRVGWFRRAVQAVWGWIKKHWPLLVVIAFGPVGAAVLLVAKHFRTLLGVGRTVWNAIKTGFNAVKPILRAVGSIVTGPVISAFRQLKAVVEAVVKAIKFVLDKADAIGDVAGKLGGAAGGAAGGVADFLNPFASGGVVAGGGTQIVGEHGRPEILKLPSGSRLTPIPQGPLAAMVGGDGRDGHWQPIILKVGERVLAETTGRAVRKREARK